jgi:hypothetical protein
VGPSNYLNRHKFGIKIVMADFTFWPRSFCQDALWLVCGPKKFA